MGLTVSEKQHWKDRIARRIDKKIEAIKAESPNLIDRIQKQARDRALQSLGIAEQERELESITQQKEALEKREERAQKEMLARVQGVPVEDVRECGGYYGGGNYQEVTNAIECRQAVHEEEFLAEDPLGQKILALRREKEELLDTVWLATGATQIRQLWAKVAELLGEPQSPLQTEALAIEPPAED
jgi:hypothetical protein